MSDVVFKKAAVEAVAKWWTAAALRELARAVVLGFVLMAIAGVLATRYAPTDDSDGSWRERSGFVIRTDHLTGCQYLEAPHGGLLPRTNAAGGQVCLPTPNTEPQGEAA